MKRKVIPIPCEAMIGGDAFVQVMDMKITGTEDSLKLEIYAMNLHEKELTELDYEVFFFDSASIQLNEEAYIVKSSNINIKSGEIDIVDELNIPSQYSAARKALVKFLKGNFSDGNSINLFYDEMEKITFKDLGKNDLESIKEVCGEDAYTIASDGENHFRCVCGYFNGKDSSICSNCGREKAEVLENYSSIEKINEILVKMGQNLENDVMSKEVDQGEFNEDSMPRWDISEEIFKNHKIFLLISLILFSLSVSMWVLWRL